MKRIVKRLFVYFLSLALVLPNFSVPAYASELSENMETKVMEQFIENNNDSREVTVLENDIAETEIGAFEVQAAKKSKIMNQKLSLGGSHSAAIKKDGSLWLWGDNFRGQIGDGTSRNNHYQPIKVMEDVISVSLGKSHSAAIKEDGSLWLWGDNDRGQIGDDSIGETHQPIKIMEDVISVSLGGSHSAAIKEDGSLWLWGKNYYGQIGDGTSKNNHYQPTKIMEDVVSVSLGDGHSAAIKEDGSLWLWGYNDRGQIGDGTREDRYQPVKIMEDVVSVSLGFEHSAAIKEDGSLWLWGSSLNGEIGDGTGKNNHYQPTKIMEDVVSVSLGFEHSAAIKEDGSLWLWGSNLGGEIGDGTGIDRYQPVRIMEDVISVSLGYGHSAAIKKGGSLWLWGQNSYGEIGDGNQQIERLNPIEVMPENSIDISDDNDEESQITFPVSVTSSKSPKIKVLDSNGKPISGVSVVHRGTTFTTGENGVVDLINYKWGESLEISKVGYTSIRISDFIHRATGYNTYTLTSAESPISRIIMELNGKKRDLLKEEATINLFYKTTTFSIECEGGQGAFSFELYSGNNKIASSSDGKFPNLKYSSFEKGKDVVLKTYSRTGKVLERRRLAIEVIDLNVENIKFSLGEDFSIEIPKGIPLLGGEKLEISLGELPVTCEVELDGKMKIGINATELVKKDKDWFSTLKKISSAKNKGDVSFLYDKKKKKPIEVKFIGYLESNVLHSDYMKGQGVLEISAKKSSENQFTAFGVPIVVEVSISGKVNGDGSITYKIDEGFSGKVSAKGEFGAGLYGGVGVAKVASVGVYGEAGIGVKYDIFPKAIRGFNELYVKGQAGVKVKLFGKNLGKLTIVDGKYYIINNDTSGVFLTQATAPELMKFSIDNQKVYQNFSRTYLNSNSGDELQWDSSSKFYTNGNVREAILQESTYLDIVPNVIKTNYGAMLFYLTDGGTERSSADRSQLVYSVYDEVNTRWSEPQAVLDDGTADFSPDFYAYNDKIYIVWQNAENSLEGELSLNEIADHLTLQIAVYDELTGKITDLGIIENESNLFQQRPQIAVEDGKVCVYWYENSVDNVLGLSGKNALYQAIIAEADAMQNMEVIGVMEGNYSDFDLEEAKMTNQFAESQILESAEWLVNFLGEEEQYITSADAGIVGGKMIYAYSAGELDDSFEVIEGRVVLYTQNDGFKTLENGKPEHVEIGNVFSQNTLCWYQEGDIHYINEQGEISTFFNESRLSSSLYTMITDNNGIPEIIYPVGADGKSNLYRIAYENGEFLNALAITEQDNYIQYVDGFVNENETVFVYNQMEVDENLEEVNNSLCIGIQQHSYEDLMLLNAGSMVGTLETGEKVLDITAQIYNNGTVSAESLSLQLAKSDGSVLETKTIDCILEPGEEGQVVTEYSLSNITEEADYIISIVGNTDNNTENNSTFIRLGEASLQIAAEIIAVGDSRTLQLGIENNGITSCGGKILICDANSGEEYANSSFDTIVRGELIFVEVPIARTIFADRKDLALEISVISENNEEVLSEQLVTYAPTYAVNFITDEGEEQVYIAYGETVIFPENPVKEGAIFKGWYTSEDAETGIRYTEETPITENVNLYAQWTKENQVSLPSASIPSGSNVEEGTELTLTCSDIRADIYYTTDGSEPTKESTLYTQPIVINESVTIKAIACREGYLDSEVTVLSYTVMPKVMYTIAFDKNSAEVVGSMENQREAEGSTAVLKQNRFTRTGYQFTGWNTKADGTGISYADRTPIASIEFGNSTSLTLYAQWEELRYVAKPTANIADGNVVVKGTLLTISCNTLGAEIYYTTDGTTPSMESTKYTAPIPLEEAVTVKAIAVKEGYEDSEILEVSFEVTEEEVIYTFYFDKNSTEATGEMLPQTLAGNGWIFLNYNAFVWEGYLFNGWNTKADGTGTAYRNGHMIESYEMTGETEITLYAQWEKMEPLEVVTASEKNGSTLRKGTKVVLEHPLNQVTIRYTTDGTVPTEASPVYTQPFVITEDITIFAIAYKDRYLPSEPVVYSYKVAETGEIYKEDIPEGGISKIPEGLWIAGVNPEGYEYTGKAVKPQVRVYDHMTLLEEKKDYTISYSKNTKANDGSNSKTAPTITVKGKGNYSGKDTAVFKINARNINTEGILACDVSASYNKKQQKPVPAVYENGKKLKPKKDYTLEYVDMGKAGAFQEPGDYVIRIHGTGNYTGTRDVSFAITETTLISKASISKIKNQSYNDGEEIRPSIEVKYKGEKLVENTDYTVSYVDNTKVGKATAILRGIGEYSGVKYVNFNITAVPLKKTNCYGLFWEVNYTGKEVGWKESYHSDNIFDYGGKALKEGVDFTVTYKNNTKVGKATVIFTGINGYTGTVKKSFKITPYSIWSDRDERIMVYLGVTDGTAEYEKGGAKPEVTVMFGNQKLTENVDYKLAYKDTHIVSDDDDYEYGTPTVVVKGKGNFKDDFSLRYTIVRKDISNLEMVLQDVTYKNKAGKYKAVPKVKDVNGKTLTPGKDYEKEMIYRYVETTTLANGTIREAGAVAEAADIVPAGTRMQVTVSGNGTYKGELTAEYCVVQKSLAKAKVKIAPQIYTGKEIRLEKNQIAVTCGKETLRASDYEIISYEKNIQKGTAKVTLKGVGNYGGTVTASFKIKSKTFSWWK